jgi:hypothetical protein
MLTIESTILQKEAEVARLLEEIETLRRAQEVMGASGAPTRKGRPKGSKNKTAGKRRRSRKAKGKVAVEAAPIAPAKKTRKRSPRKASKKAEASAEG